MARYQDLKSGDKVIVEIPNDYNKGFHGPSDIVREYWATTAEEAETNVATVYALLGENEPSRLSVIVFFPPANPFANSFYMDPSWLTLLEEEKISPARENRGLDLLMGTPDDPCVDWTYLRKQ